MKVKRDRHLLAKLKRRIQDVPFYALKYEKDDLPFDPAKSFILEQIERVRKTKPVDIFGSDLDFRKVFSEDTDAAVPNKFTLPGNGGGGDVLQQTHRITANVVGKGSFLPSLVEQENITKSLLKMWKENKRDFRIKTKRETPEQINRRMRMKFLPKIEAMTPYETIGIHNFHVDFDTAKLKPRRRKKYEFKPLPSVEEQEAEMERAQKIVDKMLQPHLERYARQKEELDQDRHKYYTTLPEIMKKHAKLKEKWKMEAQVSKKRKGAVSAIVRKRRPEENAKIISKLIEEEKKKLRHFAPIMPSSIEAQKNLILSKHDADYQLQKSKFTPEMQQKFSSLLTSLSATQIQEFPSNLLMRALPKVSAELPYLKEVLSNLKQVHQVDGSIKFEMVLLDLLFDPERDPVVPRAQATMIVSSLVDLQEDFRERVCLDFLRMLLHNESCQKILGVSPPPPHFPVVTIKAPVPWKCAIQLARNRLDQVLMTCHPVLQAINMLWYELYNDLVIVNTKRVQSEIAPDSTELTHLIEKCCSVAREILLNDWLPRLADLIDSMRPVWEDLIARKSRHGGRAAIMFNAIHSLMSLQLQRLIKRSVDHLYGTLQKYSNGNLEHALGPENAHSERHPFMTLKVSVVGKSCGEEVLTFPEDSVLNTVLSEDPKLQKKSVDFPQPAALPRVCFIIEYNGKLLVEPYIGQLPDIFVNYFKSILRVGHDIPRMEYFMSGKASERGYLQYIPEDHVDMELMYEGVRKIVAANQEGPRLFLKPIYDYYYPVLSGKLLKSTENLFLQKTIPSLTSFQTLMDTFNELVYEAYYLRNYVPLNMFMLDNRKVNKVLVNMINDMKNFVTDYFRTKNLVENRKLCDEFEEISLHAGERPKETPEVVALQNYLNECRDQRLFALKNEIKLVAERVLFLLHYATLDAEDIHLNSRTFLWPSELEQVLDLSAARLSVVREGLETALRERRAEFEIQLLQEKKKVDTFRSREIRDVLSLDELREKVETVDQLCGILKGCNNEADAINIDENLLQIDQSYFPILTELLDKMDPIEKLWRTAYQFDSKYEGWFFGPFAELNATAIRTEVEEMSEIINKLARVLVTNPQAKRYADQIRIKIDKFKVYLPILEGICREGLSERHWLQISEELGQPVSPETYKTLASLVEIDIFRIADRLEEISNAAAKEFELNNQLLDMQSEWADVMFDITQYRDSDTMILSAVDDIQGLLDDHILKAQAMRGSPYIAALGEKATSWEDKLISMQDILDIWIKVQSMYMYLEPIFNSEDIMRQMPAEGRNFKSVDRVWRKIMKHTEMDRRVIQTTDFPNMLATLQKGFSDLEDIQKGLNMYLEKKRLFFARFYFLSNDELLEILSETKDPLRVQPHLKKCFEGINSLQFDANMEIIGIVSLDGETIPLTKKINPATANGLVEKWLKDVQLVMVESIQEQLRSAYDIYYASVRKNWCLKWPGQIVQTIASLTWTSDVEEAITKGTLEGYLTKCECQLEDSVALIRGGLSSRNRTTLQSLIILETHNVSVLKQLVNEKVTKLSDFTWMRQLRYNWRVDEIDKIEYVFVNMVTTAIQYGLEYLGNMTRIIRTPDTDRCFIALMNAIKFNLAGAPEGPAGAGKTETCKDLAKAVGKKMVVFNCALGLENRAIGKFLKGLVQSGCWACFDDFNRIHVNVLSVVAQQILTIQRAIARKAIKFTFEDTNLKLDATCCIFITINPTPTSVNNLPDNLKVRFRTVALSVPDIRLIFELTLFSSGFVNSQLLAGTFVNFLRLGASLLSAQGHYDFGMRSVKTILRNVMRLKEKDGNSSEQQLLYRAVNDLYAPQLVQLDVDVFARLCGDLFENIELKAYEGDPLVKQKIEDKLKEKSLLAIPWFVEKIMQLYEMLSLRHGIMLIGEPMSGKTTCYQVLMEVLRDMQKANTGQLGVSARVINPKSISIAQLFGAFHPETLEWQDGVLAKTFRDMANSSAEERQWIIFDGPVDELWIENLNTVLDDNKKLCLMSGEIIQMSKEMTLLFETIDLKRASPATISRCGMIYMDREKIGWRSIHKTFLDDLRQLNVSDNNLHLYEILIDWLIEPSLEILNATKCVLKVSAMHQYKLLKTFFNQFLSKQPQYNATWFQQAFLFSWVWAYFSVVGEGRKEVDSQIRRILYGSNEKYPKPKLFTLNRGQIFPEKMNFMDYRFDGVETWWPWLKSDEQHLTSDLPVIDILVPTMETSMASYWMEFSMKLEIPLLLVGPSGSGKSAIVKGFCRSLAKDKYLVNRINLSAKTSSKQVQDLVMAKLDRRRKGVFGPPVGRKCLIFIDDLAISQKEANDAQPPLELFRQWADHKYWSDLKDTSKVELIDLLFVGAMGLPGGSNFIHERLYRHMFVVAAEAMEYGTMQRIFNHIGDWHFSKDFPEVLLKQAKALCASVLDVFTSVKQSFVSGPQKLHYQFSMLEVSRIYQGISMVPAKRLQDSEKLVRLWAHEIYRVIGDRLLEAEERSQMFNILQSVCSSKLRMSLSQAFGEKVKGSERLSEFHLRDLIFGNFMEPDADPKIYDEVDDGGKLEKIMQFYLNEYNRSAATPMDLVLFNFAIEHVSKVARILQMPRGNVLLFGLGGSGRRSVVKLAATIADAHLIQPEITKSYSTSDWAEDMKQVLLSAGMDYKKTVLLFSDNQGKEEQFFEDIHSLLSCYDLNNVFAPEEKVAILDKMQVEAKAINRNIESTPMSLYGYFTERVEEKLHIALIFSSVGDSLRQRLQIYPSLRNCCSITFFPEWTRDALVRVAEHYITSMDLGAKIGSESPTRRAAVPAKNQEEGSPTRACAEPKSLATVELERKLVDMTIYFNKTALLAAKRMSQRFGRKLFITPTLYLELLHLFKRFHGRKYEEITTQRDRYMIGLEKLDSAANEVEVMQKNLFELQPQLKILSEETERIMVNIERETAEAEKKKEVVGADEAAANEAAASAQAIKDDCESDLQEAIPALDAALSALDTLKPADITVVKSMKNPPLGVKLVLEAVCVIKGIKADRKTDPTGKTTEDFWAPSLRMLGDMKFLESLKTFDKDNINVVVMKKIRERFIVDREFVPEKIKSISMACEGLCRWVRAMEIYDRVAKIVAPKKLALAAAEAELAQQMEKLNAKRAELQEILDKLQKLNDFFAEKSREKKRLEDEIDNCEKKLFRAERLLGGLGGEKIRWSEKATELNQSLGNVVGDVLLAAGSVALLGPFTMEFREEIICDWNKKCQTEGVPCSAKFNLIHTLGHPTQIRAWGLCGLPTDSYSVNNALIVTNARRHSLMIDPQGQANKWIKNLERENNLQVVKLINESYLDVLEEALTQGQPVLLENVGQSIDPGLHPILAGNVVKKSGGQFVHFRGKLVEFNSNFRLYMTTNLRNPTYDPETAVLVTVLNFMITEQGLRDQLLAAVVNQEKPDLQEKKELLLVESAHNRDSLYQIETQILQVLSSSEGNILEDENAINILSSSKSLSEEIEAKQQSAEATEAEIDVARQIYVPVAKHSANLFFCILDLAGINNMYHFSLGWYLNMFAHTIERAPKGPESGDRMQELNRGFTKSVYKNICRALYEKDKLIFSFLMTVGVLRSKNEINEDDLATFIIGSGAPFDNKAQIPKFLGMDKELWERILRLSTTKRFLDLHKEVAANPEEWSIVLSSSKITRDILPDKYKALNDLSYLCLLKCLSPDGLIAAVKRFIWKHLGQEFIIPPAFDIKSSYDISSPSIPLIFLISKGSDPMEDVLSFARYRNMAEKCKILSLGQDHSAKTMKVLVDCIEMGHWVVLQNCHFAGEWLEQLEKLFLDMENHETKHFHRDFRLWCTSESYENFPISMLQNSVKMTNETPQGVRMNLERIYHSDIVPSEAIFNKNSVNQSQEGDCQRVVLGLVLFHTILLQRRQFGSIGWNCPSYEFNDSDLRLSIDQLIQFCKSAVSEIPFEGHKYLTGECYYGGQITDQNDRRTLLTLLEHLYNSKQSFADSMNYQIPDCPDRTSALNYISSLPVDTPPELLGLHANAQLFRKSKVDTDNLILGTMLSQTELLERFRQQTEQQSNRSGLLTACESILSKVPEPINVKTVLENFPISGQNALNVVLYNETLQYNDICKYVANSLQEVARTLKGEVSSTAAIDRVQECLAKQTVPANWIENTFMTRKNLSGFLHELTERVKFFKAWVEDGEPTTMWIGAFLCPQAVFEALRWNFAKHTKCNVDEVTLKISPTAFEGRNRLTCLKYLDYCRDNLRANEDFKCFYGLHLEGGRWNREEFCLDESLPRVIYDQLPIFSMHPSAKTTKTVDQRFIYNCPVYKTTDRYGFMTTTGHSTNFVMHLTLPSKFPESHFILRGCAAFFQLDN